MKLRTSVSAVACSLLVSACGGGDEDAAPVDTSLGLDARPANPSCLGSNEFPDRLSEHPCFAGEPPVAGTALVPYSVNAPLWSDAADKLRYFAVPDGSALEIERDGDVRLPAGGVLVKEFALEGRRLETRLFVLDETDEWHAATYVWNDAQTDARLTREGVEVEVGDETWSVPTEQQCFECHTDAAGVSLGLEQQQLARTMEYPETGRTADQLHTLRGLGLLEGESEAVPLASPADTDMPLEDRARAYLHANCAHCHRPGGMGEGEMDLRASTPLRLTRTCNEVPVTADPIPGGGFLLRPGEPEASGIYVRMTSEDPTWRMPPVGTALVDRVGSDLIEEWIESLDGCPE